MPQTESEKLKSGRPSGGRQPSLPVPGERRAGPGQPHPSDPASLQPSAWASGTQMTFPLTIGPGGPRMTSSHLQSILLQQCHGNEEEVRQLLQLRQHRPSVLRQGGRAQAAPLQPPPQAETASAQTIHLCKVEVEVDTGSHRQSSPPHSGPSPRHSHHSSPSRRTSPTQSNITARHHDGLALLTPGGSSALFLNGHCRWPGCDSVFEEFPNFLKHLHADHGHGDKSTAQWRVQQDMVQYMENQLTLEKQKLFAMQLHLHLSELKYPDLRVGSDWTHSLALVMPQAQAPDGASRTVTKQSEELAQPEYWPTGPAHLLPDLVPSMECYKYNNIRPPYTYACLIRWAILEAPDKQRTLNEIYNWFTTMFFYFRHNTATWKNAVRHNLSLHKCFVRVEGGKGAVWTVDETEYQRRKGQKYHRDHPMRWLTPYSFFRPGEP